MQIEFEVRSGFECIGLRQGKASAQSATDRQTDRQSDRHTKVKTLYPPVSLRSLGGYNETDHSTYHYISNASLHCLVNFTIQ